MVRQQQQQQQQQPTVLIAGNYTHDVLIIDDVVMASTLGGAASFISTVHHALSISSPLNHFISKVGPDFSFSHSLLHSPILSPTNSPTTLFHAIFSSDPARPDRSLTRVHSCDPILPSDIPNTRHTFAMAVGVGGEILPETLEKMISLCEVVFVDIQALIRVFDDKGVVSLIDLKESGFYHLLPRIGFLKASAEEAAFMEVEEVREMCNVVVTNGEEGCVIYFKGGGGGEEGVKVMPFEAEQVDPTGAGDSFLGGLVGGLVLGLGVVDAALLGNFFGAWTVGFLGIPKVDFRLFERVREEVQRRKLQYTSHGERLDGEKQFMKPLGHEQFHAALTAAKLMSTNPIQELQQNLPNSPRAIQHGCDLQYAGQQKSYNIVYEGRTNPDYRIETLKKN